MNIFRRQQKDSDKIDELIEEASVRRDNLISGLPTMQRKDSQVSLSVLECHPAKDYKILTMMIEEDSGDSSSMDMDTDTAEWLVDMLNKYIEYANGNDIDSK